MSTHTLNAARQQQSRSKWIGRFSGVGEESKSKSTQLDLLTLMRWNFHSFDVCCDMMCVEKRWEFVQIFEGVSVSVSGFRCYFVSHHTQVGGKFMKVNRLRVYKSSRDELVIIYWYQTGRDDGISLWWMVNGSFQFRAFHSQHWDEMPDTIDNSWNGI